MEKKSLKRPKIEQKKEDEESLDALSHSDEAEDEEESQMTEEALRLLIHKMENTVHKYKTKMDLYKSKMEFAEKKVIKTKEMLSRLQSNKLESFVKKPLLLLPPKVLSKSTLASSSSHPSLTPEPSNPHIAYKGNTEENRQLDLTQELSTRNTPSLLNFNSSNLLSSQHKRKLRCLEVCPNTSSNTRDIIFATSALDGHINVWEVESLSSKNCNVSLLSSFDFRSPKEARWPEDIAWHPEGDRIFSVHTADHYESQVAMLNVTQRGTKNAVFLQGKPHVKGIINRINFMPWLNDLPCFATCGSDHGVVLWREGQEKNLWTHQLLHHGLHTSAVMASFGLQNTHSILSVGMDKRVVLYNLVAQCCDFKYVLDAKCLNVLPNPRDSHLYMVQLGVQGKQLRLFDIREKPEQVHAFGWNQDKSESQSALVNSAWSPDGLRVSAGSADNLIHFFDIRYNGNVPSQSLKAHNKRVFKAAWHQTLPFLFSISSDLNIGVHTYQ